MISLANGASDRPRQPAIRVEAISNVPTRSYGGLSPPIVPLAADATRTASASRRRIGPGKARRRVLRDDEPSREESPRGKCFDDARDDPMKRSRRSGLLSAIR